MLYHTTLALLIRLASAAHIYVMPGDLTAAVESANNGDVLLWDTMKTGDALVRTLRGSASARAATPPESAPAAPP